MADGVADLFVDVSESNAAMNSSISSPSSVDDKFSPALTTSSNDISGTVILCISESSAQHIMFRCEVDFSLFAIVMTKK